ncbi:MAG: Holliday junction resolvase RuvX [Muribaculaceae bacterium]|nr:Holliday junction resolvase RuvX [Muribaculaceae bacterium]
MGRLIALDLGKKRCGIAATDTSQIIATGIATVETHRLEQFLTEYFKKESVDKILVGEPLDMHGKPSEATRFIIPILNRLKKLFPAMTFENVDERFTSSIAHKSMIECGMKKSHRQLKENADVMAATIMLNDYLESKKHSSNL